MLCLIALISCLFLLLYGMIIRSKGIALLGLALLIVLGLIALALWQGGAIDFGNTLKNLSQKYPLISDKIKLFGEEAATPFSPLWI